MKTDAQLKQDVVEELAWDAGINSSAVGVSVCDGVVSLHGQVDSYVDKRKVERAVKRVGGVRAIALDLDVRLAPGHVSTDADLAAAAIAVLERHSELPANALSVTVDAGVVTLCGQVDSDSQRRSALDAVGNIRGIENVVDEIILAPKPAAAHLLRDIERALTRQAFRESRNVRVALSGGVATLQGSVDSWHECDLAERAVAAAPGVLKVVNELRIG